MERLLDSYEVERRAVVVEDVSTYRDVLTRLFLQVPSTVRDAAFLFLRLWLSLSGPRKLMIRRATMIGFDYEESPLLDQKDRAAGVRLPNPMLHSPEGNRVRLYDLLSTAPVILQVAESRKAAVELPVGQMIHIGPGGFEDAPGCCGRCSAAIMDGYSSARTSTSRGLATRRWASMNSRRMRWENACPEAKVSADRRNRRFGGKWRARRDSNS